MFLFFGGVAKVFVLCQPFLRGRMAFTPMSTINASVEDLANYLHHRSVHSDYNIKKHCNRNHQLPAQGSI